MWRQFSIAIAALLMVTGPAAAETKETVLAPSMPWNLDETEKGCALRRTFGTDQPPFFLEMRRFAPGDGFVLIVSGRELRSLDASSTLKVRYGKLPQHDEPVPFSLGETVYEKNQKPVRTIFASSNLGQRSATGIGDTMTSIIEAQATNVVLEWADKRIEIKTGPLDKAFAAMRKCTDALVESWGLDPEVQGTLARRAWPINQAQWAREIQGAYPPDLASNGQQARVNVLMMVDATGKPTDCKVINSYNNPKFDAVACAGMMKSAQFTPALDHAGNAVASYYNTAIKYSISR